MIRATLVTLATTLAFYRQNPLQALFVLTGLVLGCGLYTAVAQINASAKASYAQADEILGASAQWRITDRLGTDVAIADYIRLRRSGFTNIYPVIEKRLASRDGALISIIATDLLVLPLTGRGDGSTDDSAFQESPFGGSGWSRFDPTSFRSMDPRSDGRASWRDGGSTNSAPRRYSVAACRDQVPAAAA